MRGLTPNTQRVGSTKDPDTSSSRGKGWGSGWTVDRTRPSPGVYSDVGAPEGTGQDRHMYYSSNVLHITCTPAARTTHRTPPSHVLPPYVPPRHVPPVVCTPVTRTIRRMDYPPHVPVACTTGHMCYSSVVRSPPSLERGCGVGVRGPGTVGPRLGGRRSPTQPKVPEVSPRNGPLGLYSHIETSKDLQRCVGGPSGVEEVCKENEKPNENDT